MGITISLLKTLYYRNKLFFVITIVAALVFIVGCAAEGGSPPSGPIGGGC